ncbi:MAG: mevalonate kinase [Promicromonosporaceae bacterium]|nr:mevalonate kinase [Promicromonosporaceae bacterium]
MTFQPRGIGSAHAKAILLGEHSVVYGAPAIALPVPALTVGAAAQRVAGSGRLSTALYDGPAATAPAAVGSTVAAVRATLAALGDTAAGAGLDDVDVRVDSAIPAGRGLGSSAAVAAAVADAVANAFGRPLDAAQRHHVIMESERIAHGTPSGLDARTVVSSRPVWFHERLAEDLPVGAPGALVLADTGSAAATLDAVAGVRTLRQRTPGSVDATIDALARLTAAARTDLAFGDLAAVGAAMDQAHALLSTLGVSSPALDHLVAHARRAGALGAKLTGGGRGGCVIALADDADAARRIALSLRDAGAPAAWTLDLVPAVEAVAA